MKYIIAIIHTITLVAFPLFMIPFLQWYKRTFLEPNTDISGVYILLICISLGMLFITIFRWVVALKDDKHINI